VAVIESANPKNTPNHLFKIHDMAKILLWCHGGCFGGGTALYDRDLRHRIAAAGWTVDAVDFPTDDFKSAQQTLLAAVKNAQATNPAQLVIGGVSSGGFLAYQIAQQCRLPSLLLCPVLAPAARHTQLRHRQQALQLRFFHSLEVMRQVEEEVQPPVSPTAIVYGTEDDRAPGEVHAPWAEQPNVQRIAVEGGHTLCKHPPMSAVMSALDWIGVFTASREHWVVNQ